MPCHASKKGKGTTKKHELFGPKTKNERVCLRRKRFAAIDFRILSVPVCSFALLT